MTSMPAASSSCSTSFAVARIGFGRERHGRGLVGQREGRDRVGSSVRVDEQADDPVGMRRAYADVGDLASGGPRPRRAGARERAQHAVHVPALTGGHDFHGLPDCRMRRDAEEQLVGTEPDRGAHLGFEIVDRLLRHLGELEVERALHPDRAVHELGDEAAVARREP